MLDSKYLDDNGLPVTVDGDGGDSCADAGTIWALSKTQPLINMAMYNQDGEEPVRHPNKAKWYGRPGRFSRDQLIPYLCFLIMWPAPHLRENLFRQHKKKWLVTTWNRIRNFVYEDKDEHYIKSTPDVKWDPSPKMPDLTLFEVWGLWIRAYRAYLLYPLLLIFDLETLGGTITWWWREDRLTRNHLLVMYVTNKVMPTPWSWLTWVLTPKVRMVDAWEGHCAATGEIPTADLFRKAIFHGE